MNPKDNQKSSERSAVPTDNSGHFSALVESTLNFFTDTADRARKALAERRRPSTDVLASENSFTSGAIKTLNNAYDDISQNLHRLVDEPAIARVVVRDEHDKYRIFFITRGMVSGGSSSEYTMANYRSPFGRLKRISRALSIMRE